jgi:hypothetical protein
LQLIFRKAQFTPLLGILILSMTPDFTGPMWDTVHAPNSDIGTFGCAFSCEKDGKMIRDAKLSVTKGK